jgi:UDP-N-acetylmuramoylalanine--D-glutamate ligase
VAEQADALAHLEPAVFAGQAVLVAGLGKSGKAAASHLAAFGANVLAVDDNPRADAPDLTAKGVKVHTGPGALERLEGRSLLIVSPGLPERHPLISAALTEGIPVWSDVELAARLATCPLVGVTGTNGKTTTTELAAAMVGAGGLRVTAAGNVGLPLIDAVMSTPALDAVVVELSSFQLRFTSRLRLTAGAWLNFAPDHLDWHPTLADYAEAKARVWANQTAEDWALYWSDDPVVKAHAEGAGGMPVPYGLRPPAAGALGVEAGVALSRLTGAPDPLWRVAALRLPGQHNLLNALAASGLALALGVTASAMARAVSAFRPSDHRLATVGEVRGVTFVNDSKATNPHAAERSLQAFRRVVWVAGGRNKGLDFDELAAAGRDRLVGAVLLGEAAEELAYALGKAGFEGPVVQAASMQEAVTLAFGIAEAGDTVLLAPACASFDMFSSYAERGEAFAAAVDRLASRDRGPAFGRGKDGRGAGGGRKDGGG